MYMYICTQCVWWCVLRQLTAVHGPQITGTNHWNYRCSCDGPAQGGLGHMMYVSGQLELLTLCPALSLVM